MVAKLQISTNSTDLVHNNNAILQKLSLRNSQRTIINVFNKSVHFRANAHVWLLDSSHPWQASACPPPKPCSMSTPLFPKTVSNRHPTQKKLNTHPKNILHPTQEYSTPTVKIIYTKIRQNPDPPQKYSTIPSTPQKHLRQRQRQR